MSTGNLYAPVSRLADLIARWGGDTASRIVQWRQQALRSIETLVHRYDSRTRSTGAIDPAAFCIELARHLGPGAHPRLTRINSIEASAGVATADGARIHARHFVLATHSPAGFNLVQAEMEVYREYGVAVPVATPPAAGIH